jgi:hypothetical protein
MYCAEDIKPEAVLCKPCGKDVLEGCASVTDRGERFTVGRTDDGRWGLWDGTKRIATAEQCKKINRVHRRWIRKTR